MRRPELPAFNQSLAQGLAAAQLPQWFQHLYFDAGTESDLESIMNPRCGDSSWEDEDLQQAENWWDKYYPFPKSHLRNHKAAKKNMKKALMLMSKYWKASQNQKAFSSVKRRRSQCDVLMHALLTTFTNWKVGVLQVSNTFLTQQWCR